MSETVKPIRTIETKKIFKSCGGEYSVYIVKNAVVVAPANKYLMYLKNQLERLK